PGARLPSTVVRATSAVSQRSNILALSPSLVHWFWKSNEGLNAPDLQGVFFPVSWHRPIDCFGRTLADHDLRRDKAFAAAAYSRPRHPQHPSCSQAGRQFAAQRSSALDEQCLIDGFVADTHCLVVRKVDRQAPG